VRDLVVVGGGGHGRELLGVIDTINAVEPTWNVLGVVDDGIGPGDVNRERLERLGTPLLGTLEWLGDHPTAFALGVGTSATRRALVDRLGTSAGSAPTLVHPAASVGEDSHLHEGVVVYERSVITTDVTIGAHTHLNVACVVQHDSVVGEFVQFSPGVLINGDCVIGDDVFLGSGAIVTRGCTVGAGARIGAGAVVLDDVPAAVTAVGAPARW